MYSKRIPWICNS